MGKDIICSADGLAFFKTSLRDQLFRLMLKIYGYIFDYLAIRHLRKRKDYAKCRKYGALSKYIKYKDYLPIYFVSREP